MIRISYLVACTSWIALALLCAAWEGFLAPLRPGGSLMTLKALPLLVPLFGSALRDTDAAFIRMNKALSDRVNQTGTSTPR